jgi:hypothetical protein
MVKIHGGGLDVEMRYNIKKDVTYLGCEEVVWV